jgi:hypothetical protein
MLNRENTICFGDSHCEYFKDIFLIQRYDASSAKRLNNINSSTHTNEKIRQCIQENPGKYFVFYFGKVDMDFIINYKYNTDPHIDLYKYVDTICEQYITFINIRQYQKISIIIFRRFTYYNFDCAPLDNL